MATSLQTLGSLQWLPTDGGAVNLVSTYFFDFEVYEACEVETGGVYMTGTVRPAVGVVIDNLENSVFVDVEMGPIVDRVPPFTRMAIPLPARLLRFRASAKRGKTRASFFTGIYPGAMQGVNFYGALLSAQQG